ncbi:hypothetical protein [Novilysobacter spongiicola]|uniref:DUF4124 domain-containing protein n=1 Tax=Lysobacter spongiicola DSM 21749 TaxID=1122188 RepID=A0A1T4M071_9GAMM|nr:hypothetical protein [Lysobacter spongiicola]SJZ60400.1 hypothetical protein SAMN02745674_00225 [Lysobacter spongiicola DSM 21749]
MRRLHSVSVVIAALTLWTGSSTAGEVIHKCDDGSGVASYQSEPCPDGLEAAKTWAVEIQPLTAAERREQAAQRKREAADSRYLRQLAGRYRNAGGGTTAINAKHGRGSPCAAAKERRDRARRTAKRRLTYKDLERLGDMVYNACK